MLFCLMRQNRQYLFNMSYLEVFGVLTGVGVDVSKIFGVGAGGLKHGTESESEKCDSAHLWFAREFSYAGKRSRCSRCSVCPFTLHAREARYSCMTIAVARCQTRILPTMIVI